MRVPMQAPFPYNKRHRLGAAISSMGVPLASSMLPYPLRRQPDKQDRLLGSVPHAHIGIVGIDRLC